MKRREIMDRCYERTRPRPKHPSIARYMEDVQLTRTRNLRKLSLMPKNIPDRRSKTLFNWNNLHRVPNEFEEGQIFFKDEQHEMVLRRRWQKRSGQRKNILGHTGLAALDDRRRITDAHD